jgi:PAS domain S-box-containing protein
VAEEDRATVLVVEDDPGVARLQQLQVERAGYHVLVAGTAAEALRLVRAHSVDLLLLDQNLPGGVSGLELYQQVKTAGFDMPAILVTALSGESIVLQSFRTGVFDFVPKTPDYFDYLLPTIDRVLKKRRTEFRLVESEARMSGIIASAMDGIITVDERQWICVFNPAAEEMFGCTAAEAMGEPVQRFLPGWSAWPAAPPGQRVIPFEGIGLRTDGERFPVELAVSWVETPRRRYCTCLARDIRERKRAQLERERLIREQAARREAEAGRAKMEAAALENANLYHELRRADRLKDEFLAMLAHELRNPLAPIRNALHLIHLAGATLAPALADNFDIIERQVTYLVRLVDDLLDVSRISQGKIQLRREPVDLGEVVTRAVESSRPLIDARGHQFAVRLPAQALTVLGDMVRLVQVLANLLNNAAKYTPEGGQIELDVEASANGREVAVRVRDTGMGIPPEILPRLFEPFTQSERTLDRAEGGLGIGLTLVRRLVGMHGGTVQAHSAGPGLGSEFVVRLPVVVGEAVVPASPPNQTGPARRRRVLVVDDNEDAAVTLARLLDAMGHDVHTAHAGPEVLEAAEVYRPEVILLDIGLPGMDGYEVGRRLRADQRFDGCLLVALTGYGSPEDRERSQAAGFNVHMVKPVDLDALKALLRDGACG